jgi:hypothetical protein
VSGQVSSQLLVGWKKVQKKVEAHPWTHMVPEHQRQLAIDARHSSNLPLHLGSWGHARYVLTSARCLLACCLLGSTNHDLQKDIYLVALNMKRY